MLHLSCVTRIPPHVFILLPTVVKIEGEESRRAIVGKTR